MSGLVIILFAPYFFVSYILPFFYDQVFFCKFYVAFRQRCYLFFFFFRGIFTNWNELTALG